MCDWIVLNSAAPNVMDFVILMFLQKIGCFEMFECLRSLVEMELFSINQNEQINFDNLINKLLLKYWMISYDVSIYITLNFNNLTH